MYLHLLCTLAWREAAKYTASTQPPVAYSSSVGGQRNSLSTEKLDVGRGLSGEVQASEKPCRHLLLEENALNGPPSGAKAEQPQEELCSHPAEAPQLLTPAQPTPQPVPWVAGSSSMLGHRP